MTCPATRNAIGAKSRVFREGDHVDGRDKLEVYTSGENTDGVGFFDVG